MTETLKKITDFLDDFDLAEDKQAFLNGIDKFALMGYLEFSIKTTGRLALVDKKMRQAMQTGFEKMNREMEELKSENKKLHRGLDKLNNTITSYRQLVRILDRIKFTWPSKILGMINRQRAVVRDFEEQSRTIR